MTDAKKPRAGIKRVLIPYCELCGWEGDWRFPEDREQVEIDMEYHLNGLRHRKTLLARKRKREKDRRDRMRKEEVEVFRA